MKQVVHPFSCETNTTHLPTLEEQEGRACLYLEKKNQEADLASSLLDRLTSSMTLLEVEEKAVLQA
jgi:hypothetical protein